MATRKEIEDAKSKKAAAAKKRRDIAAAMTPKRRARKAENQRIGQRSDSDLHHSTNGLKRVSKKIIAVTLVAEQKQSKTNY